MFEATQEACRLRLRPILMTSFAFILGVVPLVVAAGAGAEMRRSLGTAVFSGMLGVTLFGIFLTPVFFYVIQGLGETRLFSAATARWVGSTAAGRRSRGWRSAICSGGLDVVRSAWADGDRRRLRACLVVLASIGDSRSIRPRSTASEPGPTAPPRSGPSGGGHAAVISRFFIDRPIFATVLSSSSCWRGAWPSSRCRWRSTPT